MQYCRFYIYVNKVAFLVDMEFDTWHHCPTTNHLDYQAYPNKHPLSIIYFIVLGFWCQNVSHPQAGCKPPCLIFYLPLYVCVGVGVQVFSVRHASSA